MRADSSDAATKADHETVRYETPVRTREGEFSLRRLKKVDTRD
jgi:hypothetical protein